MKKLLRRAGGALLQLLFPRRCPFCSRLLLSEEEILCQPCRRELPWTRGSQSERSGEFFTACAAPLWYQDEVRKSHHRFKFQGMEGYAAPYAALMADCVRGHLDGKFDIITWVPLDRRRLRTRGYDQARLLAERLAALLGVPCLPTLDKTRCNPPQSGTSDAALRRANVLDAYVPHAPGAAEGKHVLLVDDVMTTGATLSECARVLRTAGAAGVCCAVLAFTPERKETERAGTEKF